MIISQIMEKMIAFSEGDIHDIDHFIRVWTYAKTIGELEGIEYEIQNCLEIAAIVHDIACPLCRKKYGNTNGKLQEKELLAFDYTEMNRQLSGFLDCMINDYVKNRGETVFG